MSLRNVSACLLLSCAAAISGSAQITLHDDRVFPESIASAPDGTIFVGSIGKGEVLRAVKGATTAEVWIKPGTGGLQQVAGVLPDPGAKLLWVCSMHLGGSSGTPSAVKTFDLGTGVFKASYDFPGGTGLCNDIAVSHDGTAYATDTTGKRILRIKKGATAMDVWAEGNELAGADGIAFGDDDSLYVNSITSGKIHRIRVMKDGTAGPITEIKTSRPLRGPDGMRTMTKNTLLVAEGGANQLVMVTLEGDEAKVDVLKEGLSGITAVAQVGDTVWVNDSKMRSMRDPNTDPGLFVLVPVPLRK